ncbi:hypothetical protein BDB01DRAFT_846467 [Pilobolus umbonatus]|nr:hypothetical protein BDB01DRAFT_846467 [Pilobolus umbonatus]
MEASTYAFTHFRTITNFYDHRKLFNKLKFRISILKQKALNELYRRVLTGSEKYVKKKRPIIIASGVAQFQQLRGNVPAPIKVFKDALLNKIKQKETLMNAWLMNTCPPKFVPDVKKEQHT